MENICINCELGLTREDCSKAEYNECLVSKKILDKVSCLKAIYLPDLAFSQEKRSFVFKYNTANKRFEMESDREISYSLDIVLNDEDWEIFYTELVKGEDTEYGISRKISKRDLKWYIKK